MKHGNSQHLLHATQRQGDLSRRHFLQSLGVCVALPAFESLLPSKLRAAEVITKVAADAAAPSLASTATGAPLRMAFVYFPNGARQDYWWPTVTENSLSSGRAGVPYGSNDFQFGRTMQPLEKLKQHVQVLDGLDHLNATPGPDGAGDHARANGTFLTGVRVRKTAGADIHTYWPSHKISFFGIVVRACPQIRELRFRLLLCLPIQYGLAFSHFAASP